MNQRAYRLVLVGAPDTKRSLYFQRACDALGVELVLYGYEEYLGDSRPGDRVKLDPPPFQECRFDCLADFAVSYQALLMRMAALPDVVFLNEPKAIWLALDKLRCKKALLSAGVPTPEAFFEPVGQFDGLIALLEQKNCGRVFVKPRYGAGAAGVCAFSWNRKQGRGVLYTSLDWREGILVNTKKVTRSEDKTFCHAVLEGVLKSGAVIERWVPKPSVGGISYDLRVVWQFGHIAAVIPRGSRFPITNLHLNDLALDLKLLPPGSLRRDELETLCTRAAACVPGLKYGGFDILPSAGAPCVIEVNGQGDLIYKDIYADNQIYSEQIQVLAEGV